MKSLLTLGIAMGTMFFMNRNTVPISHTSQYCGAEYMLKSVDAIKSSTSPSKIITWNIGSTQGKIKGWVDSSGIALLQETIEDGPGILVVRYLIVENEVVFMQRRYAQNNDQTSDVYHINDQIKVFCNKSLQSFWEHSFESNQIDLQDMLMIYKQAPVRENNHSYEFISKACHALLVRFRHEHIFDIIADVEFQRAGYHLN